MQTAERRAPLLATTNVPASIVVALYRLYAILSLLFLYQSYGLREFLFERPEQTSIHAGFLLWALALLLLSAGRAIRVALLIHFCAYLYLLHPLPHGMEVYLFHMPAFWSLFMFQEQKFWSWRLKKEEIATWPLWCMGFTLALWLSAAGVAKASDPLWQRGEGLRLALSLPWISNLPRSLFAGPTLPWRLANYGVLLLELLALPLYLFSATRRLLLGAVAVLFLLLVWPIHLGFIGLFGLWILIAAALGRTPPIRRSTAQSDLPGLYLLRLVLSPRTAVGILILAALSWAYLLARVPPHVFRQHPRISFVTEDTLKVNGGDTQRATVEKHQNSRESHPDSASAVTDTARSARRLLKQTLRATLHFSPMWIFTYRELLALYEYRLIVVTKSGRTLEPLDVFRLDQGAGVDGGGTLATRWLQSAYYDLSKIPYQLEKSGSVSPAVRTRILRLIRLALKRAGLERKEVQRIELRLSPILSSRSVQPWTRVAEYQPDSEKLDFRSPDLTTEESFVIDGTWLLPRLKVRVAR